jgi:hypothetical protein
VFLDPNFRHVRDIAQGRSIEIAIDLDFMKLVATFFSLLRSHGLRGHGLVSFRGLGLWCVGPIFISIIVIVISFLSLLAGGLSLFLRLTFQVLFEHSFSILPTLCRQVILRHTTQALLAMVPKSLVKSVLQFVQNKGVEMGAGVAPVAGAIRLGNRDRFLEPYKTISSAEMLSGTARPQLVYVKQSAFVGKPCNGTLSMARLAVTNLG